MVRLANMHRFINATFISENKASAKQKTLSTTLHRKAAASGGTHTPAAKYQPTYIVQIVV